MRYGVFEIDEKGHLYGKRNTDRWDALPFYKKIIGFFSKRYKEKYIDIKPLEINLSESSNENVRIIITQ